MMKKTLKGLRHLKPPRMLYSNAGTELTKEVLTEWMSMAQRKAGLKANGGLHILRHTFCSHLAMRGSDDGHQGTRWPRQHPQDDALHATCRQKAKTALSDS